MGINCCRNQVNVELLHILEVPLLRDSLLVVSERGYLRRHGEAKFERLFENIFNNFILFICRMALLQYLKRK